MSQNKDPHQAALISFAAAFRWKHKEFMRTASLRIGSITNRLRLLPLKVPLNGAGQHGRGEDQRLGRKRRQI